MPIQSIPSNPPMTYQSEVTELRTYLQTRRHLQILDSLPSGKTLTFRGAPNSQSTKLFLGYRKQADCTTTAEIWAYISPKCGLTPPVEIWDELTIVNGKKRAWRRATAGMLRKAGGLNSPFCFLQYTPAFVKEQKPGIRDMLCAVVLYYALVAGFSDEALKWTTFRANLDRAMRWIKRDRNYQEWVEGGDNSWVVTDVEPDADTTRRKDNAIERAANSPWKNLRVHGPTPSEANTALEVQSSAPQSINSDDSHETIAGQSESQSEDVSMYSPSASDVSTIAQGRSSERQDFSSDKILETAENDLGNPHGTLSRELSLEAPSHRSITVESGEVEAMTTASTGNKQLLQSHLEGQEARLSLLEDIELVDVGKTTAVIRQRPTTFPVFKKTMEVDDNLQADEDDVSEGYISSPAAGKWMPLIIGRPRHGPPTHTEDAPKDYQQTNIPKNLRNDVRNDRRGDSTYTDVHLGEKSLLVLGTSRRSNPIPARRSPHPWRSTIPPWASREDNTATEVPTGRPSQNPYENFTIDASAPRLGEFFPGEAQDLAQYAELEAIKRQRVKSAAADRNMRRRLGIAPPNLRFGRV